MKHNHMADNENIENQNIEKHGDQSLGNKNTQGQEDCILEDHNIEKKSMDMMKEKKRKRRIIFSVLLLIFSIIVVIQLHNWINVNPFRPFELSNVYCSTIDKYGNMYVIDDSNSRLLKIDSEGRLLWKKKASGKTFENAYNISCDDEGNIYIQDVRIDSGVRLASESVVKFSTDGKFLGVLRTYNYMGENKSSEVTMRESIVGLSGQEHSVMYTRKGKDALYEIDEEQSICETYPFPDAFDTVLSCAYDNGRIWYTTYDGRLLEYVDGVNDKLLYDCEDEEGSIIRSVSYGDGKLYVADIGFRDILVVDLDTGDQFRLALEEDVKEREISYMVNADNGLVSTSSYSVSLWNGDKYTRYYEVELSNKWKILTILLMFSLLVLAIDVVIDIVLFVFYIIKISSYQLKVILGIIAGVIAIGALFLGSLYPQFSKELQSTVFSREKLAATVTAEAVPTEAFLAITKPSDYMNEDYLAVKRAVDNIFLHDSDASKDLYCEMYRIIDGTITLTYSIENGCAVYPYDWDYEGSDEQKIITTGVGKEVVYIGSSGSYIYVLEPMRDDSGEVIGLIEVGKDLAGFMAESNKMLIKLIINIVAITIVIIMFVIELFYFIEGKREREAVNGDSAAYEDNSSMEKALKTTGGTSAGIIRFLSFLIYFFTNLSTAILPIYALRIAGKSGFTFGLSKEVLSAVPISAEVIMGAVCSFFGSKVIKAFGAKKTAFVSAVLITAGLALRVVPDIWVLSLAQAILGAGWGTLLLMVNILITALPEERRDTGFAYFSAAGFSGVNCGILFGGFIIQWVSYPVMFIIVAALSITIIFAVRSYIPDSLVHEETMEDTEEEKAASMPVIKLICNPRILGFIFMMLIPAAIVGYYLNYLYPILGEKWGLSETYIGYSYLIDGLFVVLFGGLLTKVFSGKKRLGLAISSFIYAVAFVVVVVFNNIPALFASLAIVGISDGFGNPLMTGYFTDLDIVEKYGYDRAFGVYSLFENIAQTVGSFVFSYVLIVGVKSGLMIIAVALSVLTMLFLLGGIFDRRKKTEQVKIAGDKSL